MQIESKQILLRFDQMNDERMRFDQICNLTIKLHKINILNKLVQKSPLDFKISQLNRYHICLSALSYRTISLPGN